MNRKQVGCSPIGQLLDMRDPADMSVDELIAVVRACRLRLDGPTRGKSRTLREALELRMTLCSVQLYNCGFLPDGSAR